MNAAHALAAAPADATKQLDRNDLLALMAGGATIDDALHVVFDRHPVLNERASWGWDETLMVPDGLGGAKLHSIHHEGANREIYDEFDYIRITTPGDRGNEVHRPVFFCQSKAQCRQPKGKPKCDVHRFPREYFAFKGDLDQQAASGTILSSWPIVNRAQVEELKYMRIYTVEQLANVADSNAQKLGPGYSQLRQQARDFIETAKGNAPTIALRNEIEKRDAQIAALMGALEQQGKRLDDLAAKASAAPAAATAATAIEDVPAPVAKKPRQ